MKTNHGKSRGNAPNTRKTAAVATRKRLRRLHPPPEDDDDDEDDEEEVEEELSPGSSSSSAEGRKRSDSTDSSAVSKIDTSLLFIDVDRMDGSNSALESTQNISAMCNRDFEQLPLHTDDLDQLQFELETSLAQAIIVQRKLYTALKQLTSATINVSASHGAVSTGPTTRLTTPAASSVSSATYKRKFPKVQQHFSKRPGVSTASSSPAPMKRNRAAPNKDQRMAHHESMPSSSRFYYYAEHNHQIPDKFWAFVDQYSGSVTEDTVEYLRELVRDCDPHSSQSKCYYDLPDGKPKRRPSSTTSNPSSSRGQTNHDSCMSKTVAAKTKKAVGAAKRKKTVSSPPPDESKSVGSANAHSGDSVSAPSRKRTAASGSSSAAKKTRDTSRTSNATTKTSNVTSAEKNGFCLGPLTERLVQALIEDCSNGDILGNNKNGQLDTAADGKIVQPACPNSKALMKTLNLGNLKVLENRIRKELIDQGLLDPDDDQAEGKCSTTKQAETFGTTRQSVDVERQSSLLEHEDRSDDDEVTAELKRRQSELMRLQCSNHERLSNLLAKAEKQLDVYQNEETLRHADEEVLNLCSRYYGVAPTSRKPSGKKERDSLWKALKEREKAVSSVTRGQ